MIGEDGDTLQQVLHSVTNHNPMIVINRSGSILHLLSELYYALEYPYPRVVFFCTVHSNDCTQGCTSLQCTQCVYRKALHFFYKVFHRLYFSDLFMIWFLFVAGPGMRALMVVNMLEKRITASMFTCEYLTERFGRFSIAVWPKWFTGNQRMQENPFQTNFRPAIRNHEETPLCMYMLLLSCLFSVGFSDGLRR